MMRFIVCGEGLSKKESDALTTSLEIHSHAYWHWIENFWIVIAKPSMPTAKALWTQITNDVPLLEPKVIFVLSMDQPVTYWGRLRPHGESNGWSWIDAHINGAKPG